MPKAVLIGINKYAKLRDLGGCVNDVDAVSETLIETGAFGLSHATVTPLTDDSPGGPPTKENIMRLLGETLRRIRRPETFILYYAGHGAEKGGRPMLLPADYNPALPRLTGLFVADLLEEFRGLGVTERVLVLDSCHSGMQTGLRGVAGEADGEFERYRSSMFTAFLAQEGTAVLSAASLDEPAREARTDGEMRGRYSDALCKSLAQLSKLSEDGQYVTASQLHAAAHDHMLEYGDKQHPRLLYAIGPPVPVFDAGGSASDRRAARQASTPRSKLLKRMESRNPKTQRTAADKLVADFGEASVGGLTTLLGKQRRDVRDVAAYALGKIGTDEAIEHLLGALHNRNDVRYAPLAETADDALVRIGGTRVLEMGLRHLDDESNLQDAERRAILTVLAKSWSGKMSSPGADLVRRIVVEHEEALVSCVPTPYVLGKVIGRIKALTASEKDTEYRKRPYEGVPLYEHLSFALSHDHERTMEYVGQHSLYRKGFHFTRLALAAAAQAPASVGTEIAKDVRKAPDLNCSPTEKLYQTETIGVNCSLHETAKQVESSLVAREATVA